MSAKDTAQGYVGNGRLLLGIVLAVVTFPPFVGGRCFIMRRGRKSKKFRKGRHKSGCQHHFGGV